MGSVWLRFRDLRNTLSRQVIHVVARVFGVIREKRFDSLEVFLVLLHRAEPAFIGGLSR
jgi:hypothetical protein